jgi:toxin secretion/phage lysis holin
MKSIKIGVTVVLTAIASKLGILAIPVYLLLALNIADYVTAIMAAGKRGEKINSQKGLAGIFKKVAMFILVGLGGVVDILLTYGADAAGITLPGQWVFAILVAIWLICNEVISILENIVDIGVPVPPFLLPLVERIKGTIEAKGDGHE